MIPDPSLAGARPVRVEFVGLMPTLFAQCQHCMEVMHGTGMRPYSDQLDEYPEAIRRQYFELSEIAQRLRDEFGGSVIFDAIDTASPLGVWKSFKHRILRTPYVLIEGRKVFERLPSYVELRGKVLRAMSQSSQRTVP